MDGKSRPVDFVGKAYTPDLGKQMPYGAIISSKGIIKKVMTEEDYPELWASVMKIVTDTDILFDSIKTREATNILTRLTYAGHEIYVPLTVLGEVMLVGCLSLPNRKDELIDVVEYCEKIDPQVLIPNLKLRKCCQCIDEIAQRINLTDRTNLGYATAYNTRDAPIDYYVTTDGPVRHIRLPCKTTCNLEPPEIIPPAQLRKTLLTK